MAENTNTSVVFFGDRQNKKQMILGVPAQASADKPGIVDLQAVSDAGAVADYYVWVDSNGQLRKHTSIPTNQDADGVKIAQSGSVSLTFGTANQIVSGLLYQVSTTASVSGLTPNNAISVTINKDGVYSVTGYCTTAGVLTVQVLMATSNTLGTSAITAYYMIV